MGFGKLQHLEDIGCNRRFMHYVLDGESVPTAVATAQFP
jgi:hypothetical protein